jgi:glycosyltransferase involved in cell wall biosynthesis
MNVNIIEKKLVTIYCVLYNHEKYVLDSVSSILNQDYPNLQIIISDDCSTDRTFEIAQKIVSEYKGQHHIILRKNERNVGLIKHIEICLNLSRGSWIFQAAGDDISSLTRISETMRFVNESNNEIKAVFTNLYIIDGNNSQKKLYFDTTPNCAKNYKEYQSGLSCWAIGASLCFHRIVYDKYGEFVKNVMGEDGCLAFRAILEGELRYLNSPTVYYRMHDNNLSQNLTIKQKINFKKKEQWLYINHLKDAEINNMDHQFKNKIILNIIKAFIQNWLLTTSFVRVLYALENKKTKND